MKSFFLSLITVFHAVAAHVTAHELIAPGAKVEQLATGYTFTEGPATDANGDIYFSDIPNQDIHRWSVSKRKVTVFMDESGGTNGPYFDKDGQLLGCQTVEKQVVSIEPETKKVTPITSEYNGAPYNKPNDLWIDPKGGIYFTDPNYGKQEKTQDGEHVYYINPSRDKVIRVADDFNKPNGLIGTPDGKTLYIADPGAGKTYQYTIADDATLTNKKLFCESGSDGVTLDEKGNLYITAAAVDIYSPDGKLLESIETPERPANVTFGGKDNKTLFITARKSLYAIEMAVSGAE
ncbi:MAG: SMP-30/gluconolactonase/LRE family protein [Verrucomicrobiota bacterium]